MTLPELPDTPYGLAGFIVFFAAQALYLHWKRQAWRQHEADKLKWAEIMARTDDEGRRALINSRPPEPPPNLLVIALLLATGALVSLGASVARGEHRMLAVAADKPSKKEPAPKGKCGSGCAGTPPDCKCPAQTERKQQTKLTEAPHSMLGEGQPWMVVPIQTGPAL